MPTTLSKTGDSRASVDELVQLRDALREQQQRADLLLARLERVLGVVKAPEGTSRGAAEVARARPSPLDSLKAVATSTADLREQNGNLSAVRVAKLYGVSLSQLAGWMGRTKQAVSKTPDADSLQEALGYFERVARLRMVTKSDAEFRKWLRARHALLGDASPLELMAKGEWQPMADYVDDMLTGAPT